jgi:L-seryl-tRNA(Ser) seleniumtransferase
MSSSNIEERDSSTSSSLRKVINVTGTVIHTNFGRSILNREAIRSVEWACSNYVALEYDVESGRRGHRDTVTEELIKDLVGCEAATVVNNNAAAVLMCLNTLSRDREVIVSRGELIEIGGSFRLPEVMRNSGAILREVGTTNRTYIEDYRKAINENTAMLLKAHASNYRIEGSTWSVDTEELVALGRAFGILVVEDLGSGALVDLNQYGLPKEPMAKDSIGAGVDAVTFSGDKLLGGPQAGIIVGRRDLIERIRSNPLTRCVRVGKMTIAALDATLRLYINGMERNIPPLAYLTRPIEEIHAIAEEVSAKLEKILDGLAVVSVEDGASQVGSGSLPVESIDSKYVVLRPITVSADELAALFRVAGEVPVIGSIHEGRLVMDMRTIQREDAGCIVKAAEAVSRQGNRDQTLGNRGSPDP